jgi:hypothetical protein
MKNSKTIEFTVFGRLPYFYMPCQHTEISVLLRLRSCAVTHLILCCTLNGARSVIGVSHASPSCDIFLIRQLAPSREAAAGNSLTSVLHQTQRIVRGFTHGRREARPNKLELLMLVGYLGSSALDFLCSEMCV